MAVEPYNQTFGQIRVTVRRNVETNRVELDVAGRSLQLNVAMEERDAAALGQSLVMHAMEARDAH